MRCIWVDDIACCMMRWMVVRGRVRGEGVVNYCLCRLLVIILLIDSNNNNFLASIITLTVMMVMMMKSDIFVGGTVSQSMREVKLISMMVMSTTETAMKVVRISIEEMEKVET